MANRRPLRFGALGAARTTPNALIKPVQEMPEAALVALAARDRKHAEDFAAAQGIPRIHATYEDVIEDPEADVIYNPCRIRILRMDDRGPACGQGCALLKSRSLPMLLRRSGWLRSVCSGPPAALL